MAGVGGPVPSTRAPSTSPGSSSNNSGGGGGGGSGANAAATHSARNGSEARQAAARQAVIEALSEHTDSKDALQRYTHVLHDASLPSLSTQDIDFSDVAISSTSPLSATTDPSTTHYFGSIGGGSASSGGSSNFPRGLGYPSTAPYTIASANNSPMPEERRPSVGTLAGAPWGRTGREEDGIVSGAIAETGRAGAAKHEVITPWLFQDDESHAVYGRHVRTSTQATTDSAPYPGGVSAAQSMVSLRPTTPPAGPSTSSTGLPTGSTTPASLRKTRNPFSFLRKKSSSILRDYPAEAQNSPPPLPFRSPSDPRSASTTTLLRPQPSNISHTSGLGFGPSRSNRGNELISTGLDEELAEAEHLSSRTTGGGAKDKRRVLRRPRTRDRERERSRGQDEWASMMDGNNGSGLGMPFSSGMGAALGMGGAASGGANQPQEVELSLDTNFDRIDDIIDTSRQHPLPVGPMNEQLSPELDAQHPESVSASLGRARRRSTSVSAISSLTADNSSLASPVGGDGRPGTLRRLGSAGPTNTAGFGSSSSSSNNGSATSKRQVNIGDPGLRRITLAEAQEHLAGRGGQAALGRSLFPAIPGSDPASLQSSYVLDGGRASGADPRDVRKGSTSSAMSNRSGFSGVSPKTSLSNLPSQRNPSIDAAAVAAAGGTWTRGGIADPTYRFPPPRDASPSGSDLLSMRKSSASSASKAASNWMAPDSWAVQPDRLRDYLRDEDDVSDEGDAQNDSTSGARATTERDNSTSAGSGILNNSVAALRASGASSSADTTATHVVVDGIRNGSRRGTEDSNISSYSASTQDGYGRHSSVEVLAQADDLEPPSPLPPPPTPPMLQTSSLRPSSRGGAALAAAGGAAAAAAGKLGLHRPHRHRNSSRPNTAGSIGPAARSAVSVPTVGAMAEDDLMVSSRSVRGVIKRPSTVQSQLNSTSFQLRIWRHDGSHSIVSVPLYSTTAELRSVLARKYPASGQGAYRLFVTDKGHERPLGEQEKPAILQRRRMLQAGYTEDDAMERLAADDLSYLLRFVYRADSVTKFDSESFGNTEDRFRLLDLQNHNLEMVPIFLYRHADWIGSLDLSGNPMSDLPLDFVQLCTNLHTLRLSHLALKRIPQSIRQSETLTHLDVSDNRIPELSHIALDEMPHVTSIKMQNNRLHELPPYFARIETLRYLNISNNRFETFPSVLCEINALVELDISFNAISVLPPEIGNLTRLERLVLVGNSIETLPDSVGKLVNLQSIDVRRNLLQDVSILFTLPRLQSLQCEHNSLKTLDAAVGPQLRTLDIGQNPISRATLSALEVGALTSLNLSSANMAKLDEAVFTHLTSLTTLILDRNQFTSLPESLGGLAQLEFMSCTNNLLASLPESIGKLGKLRRLHVHNNNLKSLPNTLWHCSSLNSINASSNLLESFPAPPLAGSTADTSAPGSAKAPGPVTAATTLVNSETGRKGSAASLIVASAIAAPPVTPTGGRAPPAMALSLKKLRLGDNRLTDDVFGVLGVLTELEILNLSFNEIYEIPNYGLSKNTRLVELYLSGNKLSSIPADDLPQLKELRIFHLNGNKLQTLPAEIKEMRKLHNLDVGNNTLKYNIANQQYDWNWNSSPGLRYLNLSGNTRFEIKGGGGGQNAGGRSGRRHDVPSDFQRLVNLRVLGLMDVTVTEELPDENDDRRVRTSESHINRMSYGIADALGKLEHLSITDTVKPKFRNHDNESVFGLFEGRGHGRTVGSRISNHLAQWAEYRVQWELRNSAFIPEDQSPEAEVVPNVMRRAFLRMEKEYADLLMKEGGRKVSEARAQAAQDEKRSDAPAIAEANHLGLWRSGASGVLAYVVDRTLHIANVGDSMAVLSRNGSAHLVATKHEPFDRDETLRIRSAEGWVSLRGYVNDKLDVSRSFGYYHLSSIVNAAPAITTVQLSDSDEFLILANRVLWDHIPYQTAVDIARMERDDVMIAAQKLRDFAISYGAEESIMVMIIAVGDLFYNRQQRHEAMTFDPSIEAFKKSTRSRGLREDLPGDRTLARLEREVAPPIGQVALVFTDIKNSTSLWETNGGMQSAMRMHNYLLRRQLRTIGGYEVKTEGDAFMVSFPSVTAALLWCFTVQLQLLREDWPQELLECEDGKEVYDSNGELISRGLSVRMGIHWGFPVCEADPITRRMDYFGPMVNRASRISSAADGGQIMASRDVINELTALLGSFSSEPESAADEDAILGRETSETEVDEDALRLMHPNVARDVVLLRRMGFGISEVGERRLKGLETPELLNLVYPKQLAGRLAAKPDAPAPQVFEPTLQLLDISEIKQLGMLCLRLEAISDGAVFPGVQEAVAAAAGHLALTTGGSGSNGTGGGLLSAPATPGEGTLIATPGSAGTVEPNPMFGELVVARPTSSLQPVPARRKAVESYLALRPELLIFAIRDDAPDAELAGILQQLISRIVNALSTITLRHLTAGHGATMDTAKLLAMLTAPP